MMDEETIIRLAAASQEARDQGARDWAGSWADSEPADLTSDDIVNKRSRSRNETLAIPAAIRDAVDTRDGQHCRVCGRFLGEGRALHHIEYGGDQRGLGGRRVHEVDEIVTVCWMWGGNCHDRVHAHKRLYQPVLREVVKRPGLTALQLLRWRKKAARGRA